MMANSAPSQMYEHALTPLKGAFRLAALDFHAKLSSSVTFVPPRGRVMHLNASGEWVTGLTAHKAQMPCFMWHGADSYDVDNPSSTATGIWVQQAVGPTGQLNGLVATGGYHVQTTEFIKGAVTTIAYAPNQLLTAIPNDTTLAQGGMLTNAGTGANGNVKQYVDPVCGVVCRGEIVNHEGATVLDFWTYFLPGDYS